MDIYNNEKIKKHLYDSLPFEDLISKTNLGIEITPIPDEYTYLSDYYDADVLTYYRIKKLLQLMEKRGVLNKVLLDFLNTFSPFQLETLITKTNSNNHYKKLLKKRFMTSNIDFIAPPIADKPTATMLKIYADIYERDESLFIWQWIADIANNKPLRENFPKNTSNHLNKTNLINSITKDLSKFPDVKEIFKLAYNSNLRHLTGHSNAYLDDVSCSIVNINDDKNYMSYAAFFQTFYALQQIDNITTLFLELKKIKNTNLINTGFIGSVSILEPNLKSHLILFQLDYFYENDFLSNALMSSVTLNYDSGNLQIIHNDFVLHSILVDDSIRGWFTNYPTEITIVPCSLDITNNIPFTFNTTRFNNSTYYLDHNKVYKVSIIQEKNKHKLK